MWLRFCRQVLRVFVPKGKNEGSQVRSAWKSGHCEPSRRVRFDGLRFRIYNLAKGDVWTRRKRALKKGRPPSGQPIIPFPTGRNVFLVATRHFEPGYLHLVPSGQQTISTSVHIFEATSLRVAGFEDEDDAL